jgi:hypothetical protein
VWRLLSVSSHATEGHRLREAKVGLVHSLLRVVLMLVGVCRVCVMIVAGLRCTLVGVGVGVIVIIVDLLPVRGVSALVVLLRAGGGLEVGRCTSACNEYTAIHLLLQTIYKYKPSN